MTDKSARCGAKHPKQPEACTRDVGHVGMHSNGGNVTWKKAHGEAKPCGETMGGVTCTQSKGHAGDHVGKGGTWTRDRKSAHFDCSPDEVSDDDEDPFEDEVRSDEDRAFARQQREAREAHARELEEKPFDPYSTDRCSKCGNEMGEHDGKKCPKPQRSKKAGNNSPVSANTKARQASAALEETEPNPQEYSGQRILGMRRHPAAALFPLLEGEAFERFADRIQANGLRDPIVRVTVGGEMYILDGSNRGAACEQRGIKPRFVDYEGPKDMASLVAYSIDKNGPGRRHLEPSVLAWAASEAARLCQGNPGSRETGSAAGLTQAEAAQRVGVSERLVRKAVAVRKKATPKVHEAVAKGRLDLEGAEKLAKLPQDEQDELLDEELAKKKTGKIRSGRLGALVKQREKRAVVRKINEQRVAPMPIGDFGVIYGDYPWPYENSDQHDGSRGHMTYPPMKMDEILSHAREAATRAAKHCVLALWVTNLHVVNGNVTRVVEAYGATPHSMFTWPKPKAGVGTWGRGQTEHLVIASIGEPTHTLNEISTLLPSWRPAHPGEHSSKPDEVAELLAEHCGGPFLELFARDERDGWTCWGAEVQKFAGAA